MLGENDNRIHSRFFWSGHLKGKSCPTLCDPMDHTVHGILQARILEWLAFPFSRGSSQPRDRTQVSHIAGDSYQLSHKGSPSFSSYPPPKKKNEEKGTLPDSFYEASYPDTNARQRYYK